MRGANRNRQVLPECLDPPLATSSETLGRIDVLFGGRVAEEVMFNEISTGAQDDIQKATDIAKRMVMEFGMSEVLGHRSFSSDKSGLMNTPTGPVSFTKEYSEASAEKIDQEIQSILDASYKRVKKILSKRKGLLVHIAAVLTDKEVIEGKEFKKLIKEFEAPRESKNSTPGDAGEILPPPVDDRAPEAPLDN